MGGFKGSELWRQTLAARRGRDPDKDERARLRNSYLRLRDQIAMLLNEQPRRMPDFTGHGIKHVDALWETADLVCGDEVSLNPAEAYVLGCSFAFHDAAMGLATYPNDKAIVEFMGRFAWYDLAATTFFETTRRWPTIDEIDDLPEEVYQSCLAKAVRLTHADQAASLVERAFPLDSGSSLYLIEDAELREAYGPLIGELAASHWWDVGDLAEWFNRRVGAPTCLPVAWSIDGLKVACILRLADAAQLDSRRAPSFLMTLRAPRGVSRDHWRFQEYMVRPVAVGDRLSYSTTQPFGPEEAAAWRLGLEYLRDVDREFRRVDALLQDLEKPRLAIRGVARVDQPERFAKTFRVNGWEPIDADIRISDIRGHIAELGGEQLYGPRPEVALRELVQNAQDAVLARRAVDFDFEGGMIEISLRQKDDAWFLEVHDNGVGMDEDIIVGGLLDFGRSGWHTETVRSKSPGLAAGGFRPVGTFGVGFYSLFMLGDDVSVTTRHYETGQADARNLRFTGLSAFPLLSRPSPSQKVRRGTTVRVRLKADPLASGGLLGKAGEHNLVHLVKRLVPSHRVPISICEGYSGTDCTLAAFDLDSADPDRVFERLYPERQAFGMSQTQREDLRQDFGAQATEIVDENGRRLGLAALGHHLPTRPPEMHGAVLVDGFVADDYSDFVGYLGGKASRASRDKVQLDCSPAQLRAWFESQRNRLHERGKLDVSTQLTLAEILHQAIGSLPVDHHIALTADGPRRIGDIPAWAEERDHVFVSYGGGMQWDLKRLALSRRESGEPITLPDDWLVRCPSSSFPFDDLMFPRERDSTYAGHQHDRDRTWQKTWWQMSGGIGGLLIRQLCQAWSCQPGDLLAPIAERNWNDHARLELPTTQTEFPGLHVQRP